MYVVRVCTYVFVLLYLCMYISGFMKLRISGKVWE